MKKNLGNFLSFFSHNLRLCIQFLTVHWFDVYNQTINSFNIVFFHENGVINICWVNPSQKELCKHNKFKLSNLVFISINYVNYFKNKIELSH